ncbi:hypothetical protein SAMN05216482_5147 [Streptomyces sp. PAN_FS17]|nr:hypothetical protein SAMN05216482_5147 [Streptomyces sp. PAN_FS17]
MRQHPGARHQEQYLRMRSHRTTPARVFSGLSAALLRDRSISWCAVSVLTYLLALPNHARVTLRVLAGACVEERSRIVAALRELEELRYLRRVVREGEAAGQLPVRYEVFEAPCETAPRTGETEKVPGRRASSGVGTAAAARLLLTFGDYDRRLTLDAAEALRLAPLVEAWWRRGASSAEVRAAVTWGAPRTVRSAFSHIEARLRGGVRPSASATAAPVAVVEVDFRTPVGRVRRCLREKWSVLDDRITGAA